VRRAVADAPLNIVEGTALSSAQKKDLLNRLARIEGQLRGVQKLIALAEQPGDCDAVAQQMAAARKALDRCFVQLLSSSLLTQSGNATDLEQARASASKLAALFDKFG
jgi:DNA-binding FrmR family transcriptional regulator